MSKHLFCFSRILSYRYSYLVSMSKIGKLQPSLNKSLSLELETPSTYISDDPLGKIYIKVHTSEATQSRFNDVLFSRSLIVFIQRLSK